MNKIDGEYLEVVDENDNIVGIETRDKIHKVGLKHREVYVWFYNLEGIFLQLRAKDKELFPDMYDSAVSGHVEIGDSYLISALKETLEETGVKIEDFDNFTEIKKDNEKNVDEKTGKISNTFSKTYAYYFSGTIDDLKIEEGKSQGFGFFKWEELKENSEKTKKIIPFLLAKKYLELYENLELLAKNKGSNERSLKQIKKILELSDRNLTSNNWARRDGAGRKYLLEVKEEVDEALEEYKKNNSVYLEDELGDVFWVLLQSYKVLEKQKYIDSVEGIFSHLFNKFSERVEIFEKKEVWDEIDRKGLDCVPDEWVKVKNKQKEELRKKNKEKYFK